MFDIITGGFCLYPNRDRCRTISEGRAHLQNLLICFPESCRSPSGSVNGLDVLLSCKFCIATCLDNNCASSSEKGKNKPEAIKEDCFNTSISSFERSDDFWPLLSEVSIVASCCRRAGFFSISTLSSADVNRLFMTGAIDEHDFSANCIAPRYISAAFK